MKRTIHFLPLLVIITMLLCQCEQMPPIPIDKLAGLGTGSIMKKEPAITTSLEDAVTEFPFLDELSSQQFTPLSEFPRNANNEVMLPTGFFELSVQSYCLHAGKYVPGSGDGYVYAPLKGPYAHIVQHILRNSVNHPEIPQRDIQVLIWAVIARTKITEMPGHMQSTAAQLLEPEEIMELNGGALELIPDSLLRKAFAHLPPQVSQVLEAEARLRQMLTKTQATYEELEQVAAPFGDPPPGEGSREVPSGRWSYHSDGYFVRYLPSSYRQTTIQLAVPEPIQIVRDDLGRITAIADTAGNRIETDYDDTIAPLIMEDDADVIGYAFRSIRFIHPDPETGEILQAEWNDVGWTFVGDYANAIQAHRSIYRSRPVVALLASRELSRDMLPNRCTGVLAQATFELHNDLWQRYKNTQARYNNVKGYFDQGEAYYDRLGNIVSKPSWNDIHNLADYKHYRDGIDVALKGDIGAKADWIGNHFEILQKAWLFAACMLAGDCEEDAPEKAYSETEPRLQLFDPSRDSAVPGNTGRQRLGLSLRPFRR